jgi:hypothetical protein
MNDADSLTSLVTGLVRNDDTRVASRSRDQAVAYSLVSNLYNYVRVPKGLAFSGAEKVVQGQASPLAEHFTSYGFEVLRDFLGH